jgi:hypothetical protein
MHKFRHLWSNLQSNFWFVLLQIVVADMAFAVLMKQSDSAWCGQDHEGWATCRRRQIGTIRERNRGTFWVMS